ncbi:MAG: DUF167 domain-containing protein [Gammaproteobacteria bacterium]|nr:DUF167 domain-containing protein [Gammaproteobacteria bacterium]MDH3972281.1 DUF167 domain-containing protein [Gammaproteobacteria bacterium]
MVTAASRDEICGWLGDSLKIRVCAAAKSSEAYAAIVKLLAEIPGLNRRAINIVSGTTVKRKIVEIESLTVNEVHTRLATKNY